MFEEKPKLHQLYRNLENGELILTEAERMRLNVIAAFCIVLCRRSSSCKHRG